MAKEKIIPSPQNYERWFRIFCYAKENRLNLSRAELVDLYIETYQTKLNGELNQPAELVEKIAHELYNEIQVLIKGATRHNEEISHGSSKLEEIAKEVTNEDIQRVLSRIMHEVKGLKSINRKFIKKLEQQTKEIERLRDELRKVKEEANVDALTGLRNRRSFERTLQEFFRDYKKFGYPFSLIMMDLDNFKDVNDTYGHLVGDRVLKEIGNILRNYLRAKDIPARTGGEEFAIILPGVTKKEAMMVAERLRKVISKHPIRTDSAEIRVTASFGVAEINENYDEPEDILREADRNLYQAKRTGKDKVVG
jgi:diguanylate cyclase